MEVLPFIVTMILLFAIAGTIIFFAVDYYKHKKAMDEQIVTTTKQFETEKSDRLSNLKYVVDQVNSVNSNMYTDINSSVSDVKDIVDTQGASLSNVYSGLGHFLNFTSNALIADSPKVSLSDLPGYPNPDVQLMKHVSAMMGMTVRDLDRTSNFELCAKSDKTRCIRFPDADGNTLIKALETNGKVVLDGTVDMKGQMNMYSLTNGSSVLSGSIKPAPNSLLLQASKTGVGANFTDPAATLHVNSGATESPLIVSRNGTKVIEVDSTGKVILTGNVSIKGNVDIDGNFSVTGTAQKNGTAFALVGTGASPPPAGA